MRRNRDFENNRQPSPGGPLLTNHLRDLDFELELLKRKRDIIQQEQEIINRYNKRQFDFEHPSNTYNRQEPNNPSFTSNNYSARYEGPSSSGNFNRPQAPKRQTPNQYWQPPSNTKNFAPTPKINPWQNSAAKQNTSFPNQKKFQFQPPRNVTPQIRPLMAIRPSMGQRTQRQFPNIRKDFKPTRQKPQQAINKLASYPQQEAKKLVSQTLNAVPKKFEGDQVLRADKTPTPQLKGRLELALGTILKEIKTNHSTDPKFLDLFQTSFIQRMLKHTIRTRIRTVMLDRVVGNVHNIVDTYRKKYPKETDNDLVQVAKDAQAMSSKTTGVVQIIESDAPEEFYKKNITKLLNLKLEEMFQKLENLSLNRGKNLEEYAKYLPDPKDDSKAISLLTSNDIIKSENDNDVKSSESAVEEEVKTANEKLSKVKYYEKFMDELIEARLPKILPKFKDTLISLLLMDREFASTKCMIGAKLKHKMMKLMANKEGVPEDVFAAMAKTSTSMFTTDDISESSSFIYDNVSEGTLTTECPKNAVEATSQPTTESTATSTTIPSAPEKTVVPPAKASPVDETTPTTLNNVANDESIQATNKTAVTEELHYVKLISQPVLPARAVIYDFLNQFNPLSIKKHKSISNLLVIGFKNLDDYNRILTVNESVVGNATILIKASEQVNKAKSTTQNENQLKSPNQSLIDSSLTGNDLDNQIDDLLTSIRKADEEGRSDASNALNDKINSSITQNDKMETSDTKNIEDNAEGKNDQELTEKTEEKLDDKMTEPPIQNEETPKINDDKKDLDINNENNDNSEIVKEKELETITETNDEDKNKSDGDVDSIKSEADKLKENLKETGRATPTRSSTRLAAVTPSSIRTRRASRYAQNN